MQTHQEKRGNKTRREPPLILATFKNLLVMTRKLLSSFGPFSFGKNLKGRKKKFCDFWKTTYLYGLGMAKNSISAPPLRGWVPPSQKKFGHQGTGLHQILSIFFFRENRHNFSTVTTHKLTSTYFHASFRRASESTRISSNGQTVLEKIQKWTDFWSKNGYPLLALECSIH